MECLGRNLRDAEQATATGQFQPLICYKIVMQILERIRMLHSIYYVHGDLKLQNILEGPDSCQTKIHLIDFGLSFKYITSRPPH